MLKCEICKKEFETKKQLSGHISVHKRPKTYKIKKTNNNQNYACKICNANYESKRSLKRHCVNHHNGFGYEERHFCKYCNKKFETGYSLGSHVRMCKLNPNFQKRYEIIKESSKINSVLYWQNLENRKKASDRAIYRNLGGVKQSRWITYNGKILGSSYELLVAQDLDKNNIRWDTCKKFSYIDPMGKARNYTPDFYLLDFDVYLDPKNDFLINNINPHLGFSDKEKIRRCCIQNNIKVIILDKTQLNWNEIQKLL